MTDQRACPTCPPGHQPRPLRGDHMICRGCAAALGQALASLPAVHAWLGHTLRRGAGQVEPVTGSREAPVPIDLAVHDHRVLIVDVLTSWARLITEEAHLSGPADTTLPTLTGWLRERLPWVITRPWADEMAREVGDLTHRAHRLRPWRAQRHRLQEPCPACDALALARHDGEPRVLCVKKIGGCGASWDEDQWPRFAEVVGA